MTGILGDVWSSSLICSVSTGVLATTGSGRLVCCHPGSDFCPLGFLGLAPPWARFLELELCLMEQLCSIPKSCIAVNPTRLYPLERQHPPSNCNSSTASIWIPDNCCPLRTTGCNPRISVSLPGRLVRCSLDNCAPARLSDCNLCVSWPLETLTVSLDN